jgi:hypothetical protein
MEAGRDDAELETDVEDNQLHQSSGVHERAKDERAEDSPNQRRTDIQSLLLRLGKIERTTRSVRTGAATGCVNVPCFMNSLPT